MYGNLQNKGVAEFSGLSSDPLTALRTIAYDRYSHAIKPFVVFTDPISFRGGIALAKFIKEQEVGEVWESDERLNPNSQRILKVYIFAPDDAVLKPWFEREAEYQQALTLEGARTNTYIPFKLVAPNVERKPIGHKTPIQKIKAVLIKPL